MKVCCLCRVLLAALAVSAFTIPFARGQAPHAADLQAWFKADAGIVLEEGQVTEWVDQTANGFRLTPPGTGPLVVADILNGLSAISFDGTTQLNGSLGEAPLTNATIFALFRYTNESSDNDYLYTLGTDGGSGSQMTLSRRSGALAYHFDGASQNLSPGDAIPQGQWLVSSQVFGSRDSSSHDLFLNAAATIRSDASVGYSADVTASVIGNWSSGGFRFIGELVELLVYNRTLGEGERGEVEEYLRERAGLPPFFKGEAEILSDWEVIQYELGAQPDAAWSFDLGGTRADQALNADASILLSDIDVTNKVVWGQFGSGSAPDFMGFVFGYQDRGAFYLFDWKKVTASFSSFGSAPQGMRVRAFHVNAGDPVGRDFWAADNPTNVTVLAQNDLAWANGADYDFSLRFTPGSFVIRVWEGTNLLETFTIEDNTYGSGRFGYFINSLQDVRFGQVFVNDIGSLRIVEIRDLGDRMFLRWVGGEPPYRVYQSADLPMPWFQATGDIWDRTRLMPVEADKQFYKIRSLGSELTNAP